MRRIIQKLAATAIGSVVFMALYFRRERSPRRRTGTMAPLPGAPALGVLPVCRPLARR